MADAVADEVAGEGVVELWLVRRVGLRQPGGFTSGSRSERLHGAVVADRSCGPHRVTLSELAAALAPSRG